MEKEKHDRDKKEIADANTNSFKKIIAVRGRITYSVARRIAQEKEAFACAGGISITDPQESKSFTKAVAGGIGPSKEKAFADSRTI